jgi:hypothetical protein
VGDCDNGEALSIKEIKGFCRPPLIEIFSWPPLTQTLSKNDESFRVFDRHPQKKTLPKFNRYFPMVQLTSTSVFRLKGGEFSHSGDEFLLECGANVHGTDAIGQTVCHVADWCGDVERLTVLVEHGADDSLAKISMVRRRSTMSQFLTTVWMIIDSSPNWWSSARLIW